MCATLAVASGRALPLGSGAEKGRELVLQLDELLYLVHFCSGRTYAVSRAAVAGRASRGSGRSKWRWQPRVQGTRGNAGRTETLLIWESVALEFTGDGAVRADLGEDLDELVGLEAGQDTFGREDDLDGALIAGLDECHVVR